MTRVAATVFFAVLAFWPANGKSITELVHLCRAEDPNLGACVRDAANSLIPQLTEGLDEFGPLVLDPLFTPNLEIVQHTKDISIDLKYINITQTGLSKMTMDEATYVVSVFLTGARIDLEKGLWKFRMTQPTFQMVGKYKSRGTMFKIAVNGEGEFTSNHVNTKVEVVAEISREKRGNDEYFKLEKFNVYYTFGTASMDYAGLFPGNEEMEFLNENSHEILSQMKPALEKVYSDLFRGYLEQMLEKLPVTRLFL